jgi:hypothetical protein
MLQTNASLLKVTGPPEGEASEGPAIGPTLWEADTPADVAPAYLSERRVRVPNEGVVLDRLLLVDAGIPDVAWTVGLIVTFERLGVGGPEDATVDIVQQPRIDDPEIPADIVTVRLTLRRA